MRNGRIVRDQLLQSGVPVKVPDSEYGTFPFLYTIYDPTGQAGSNLGTGNASYDNALRSIFSSYADLDKEQNDETSLSGYEADLANLDVLRYLIGARTLTGVNGADDAKARGISQNWVDTMFKLDPHSFYNPNYTNDYEGQIYQPDENAQDFWSQNPYYGNNDYAGENSIGSFTVNLDDFLRYGSEAGGPPIAGVDQLLNGIGYRMGDKRY